MRRRMARLLLIGGLVAGLTHGAPAHAMMKTPGSAARAADASQQACLYYTGAGVSNSFCDSATVTVIVPGSLQMTARQVNPQITVWSAGARTAQCKALIVNGKTGAVVAASRSSTKTNAYERMSFGWLGSTADSLLSFECRLAPGAGIESALWQLF